MKAEYINIIRTRKHDMRPYLRELGSVERIMRHYVSNSENIENFTEKMTSLLDQYHIALNKLSELIGIFSEEENLAHQRHLMWISFSTIWKTIMTKRCLAIP